MWNGMSLIWKVDCCEERKAPLFQADPRLRPAAAMVVEPNTKLLRLQLLIRGHKWQDNEHGAQRLEYFQSEFSRNLVYV